MIIAAVANRVARALERYCEERGRRVSIFGASYSFPEPAGDGVYPVTVNEASEFVARHHRHHKPLKVNSARKLALGLRVGGVLVGIAVMGNPAARNLDDGNTIEVRRVALIDGVKNGASLLLGACARVATAWGYRKIITYTLPEEGGASLRAVGWTLEDPNAGGGSWSRDDRPREDKAPTGLKCRWARDLTPQVRQVELAFAAA